MGDTDVRIKLSVDGKQAHNEVKLIDKELQELGKGSTPGTPREGRQNKQSKDTESTKQTKRDVDQDSRDKIFQQLSREATLIRKELQKLNQSGGAGERSGGSSTPLPTSGEGSSSGIPSSTPSSSSGGGSGAGDKLSSVLGKLATAAVALKAATSLWNYVSQGAQASAQGESLAYQTYGSTLVYTDYYDAKKDAKELGAPYGYSYDTVMNAGNTNMSRAGFTTLDAYESDMSAILQTSKAWGIDPSNLADTSGFMTSIGVTENGDQKKFADMLAESIVDAEMTGREDEQLQVLETISENLSRTMVKVEDSQLNDVMGLYTSLASNNDTLKGSRGASMVESINNGITNGSSSMDVLLGWGTKYTGVEGKVELQRIKEQGATNENLQTVINNYEQMTGNSIDSAQGRLALQSLFSDLSMSQIDTILESSLDEIRAGTWNSDLLEGNEGAEATQKRTENYKGSDVQTQESYELEKQDTKESVGEGLNNLLNPLRSWYSGLGTGGRVAVDGAVGAGKLAAGYGGVKLAGKAGKSILENIKGWWSGSAAGTATEAAAGSADDVLAAVAQAAGGSTDDVLSAAGSAAANSTDDILRAAGGAVAGSADDVLSGAGKAAGVLGKAGKIAGAAGIVIEGATTAYDAYKAHERDDDREMSQEIGGGVGSIAGGAGGAWAGAAAGAAIGSIVPGIGTAIGGIAGGIIGGIGGSLGGNALGEAAGEGVYDLATGGDKYDWTDEQKAQVQKYYEEVQRLYEEEGNNAAQKYTKQYVSPYLNSIGVSTSVTDDYNWDIGKPDFLKDVEKGEYGNLDNSHTSSSGATHGGGGHRFGSDEETDPVLDDNTKATEELTEQIKILTDGVEDGSLITNENNDELLAQQSEDSSDSKFKWWNPTTWFTSHATGNDYVPYDNYMASLHKGEMVLDKMDADDYRQGKTSVTSGLSSSKLDLNINLTGSIPGLTSENQNAIIQAVVAKISSSSLQDMISTGFTRVQNY